VPGVRLRAGGRDFSAASLPQMRWRIMGAVRVSAKPADVRGTAQQVEPGIGFVGRASQRKPMNRGSGIENKVFQLERFMSIQRIFGIVVLVVGVALLIVGMNASHSAADQISNTFTGRFTQDTAWYIFGGGAAALFGLLLVVVGARGKSA
jgi:hypothetical protein